MSARKGTRRPKARATSQAARNELIRHTLFCFCSKLIAFQHVPIAGTGSPRRCPFCGCADVSIDIEDRSTPDKRQWQAFAVCDGCGIKGRAADGSGEGEDDTLHGLMVEAANLWNTRARGAR